MRGSGRGRRWVLAALGSVAVVLTTVGAAPTRAATARPPLIAVFGDSLTVEARDDLDNWAALSGAEVMFLGASGTAPCDAIPTMRSLARSGRRPAAIVVAYSGNYVTPCMSERMPERRPDDLAAGTLSAADIDAIARSYRDDLSEVAAIWGGRPVVFVEAPPASGPRWDGDLLATRLEVVRAVTGEVGRESGRPVVDSAGDYAIGGRSSAVVPCGPLDGCAGLARVRNADGLHFCPTRAMAIGTGTLEDLVRSRCADDLGRPIPSVGARRYARILLDAGMSLLTTR